MSEAGLHGVVSDADRLVMRNVHAGLITKDIIQSRGGKSGLIVTLVFYLPAQYHDRITKARRQEEKLWERTYRKETEVCTAEDMNVPAKQFKRLFKVNNCGTKETL